MTIESPPSPPPVSLSLIVPLALERQRLRVRPVSDSGARVSVLQSGQGAHNARRAAEAALANGATALMSVGVAGALSAGLAAGDVVVPNSIVDAATGAAVQCTPEWAVALRSAIGAIADGARLSDGILLSVPHALTTPEAKRAAAERFAAVACDMESAAVGAVAATSGVPFLALRVICDNSTDVLPANVEGFVDDSGNARILPVIREMMAPGRWRSVLTMNSRFRLAQRRLNQLSDSLAPSAYRCPGQ